MNSAFFSGIILLFGFYFLAACNPSRHVKKEESKPLVVDTIQKERPVEPVADPFMYSLLANYPQFFDSILKNKDKLGLQIIYTEVDRAANGMIKFTDHYFNYDQEKYFYPASTVKLPVAFLALQKLNELTNGINGEKITGLDRNTHMITETEQGPDGSLYGQTPVYNDPTSEDGKPSVGHYVKKIFLVSDNDAFNRLYEFLGQEYINNSLHHMGYPDAQIIHRLSISLSEEENRHTNPVRFYDPRGKIIYEKPAMNSKLTYAARNTKMGKGYIKGGSLVNEPFDFSKKNRLSLYDLHQVMRAVLFPEMVAAKQRFNLSRDDYRFVYKYMSMTPPESRYPSYDTAEYPDHYAKFLFYGGGRDKNDPDIRIFNKPGDAYGFMIDVAYIVDFKNNIEFMVSAVIHCNSDGIFNDDKYDYDTVGYPFMKNLGRVIYEYELKKERKFIPDLSSMKLVY